MSDLLSQEEIDALLNGTVSSIEVDEAPAVEASSSNSSSNGGDTLSSDEADVLGEVGNISMGTSATTLSQLLGQRVNITTPKVSVMSWSEIKEQYSKPYIVIRVEYTEGLLGTNLLVLNINDVRIITNLMLGQPTDQDSDAPISELHLSALSEAMNQMVGSACTSIYTMIGKKIDISPPVANYVDLSTNDSDIYDKIYENEKIAKISFRIEVGDLIDSEIMQLIPLSFAKDLVRAMMGSQEAAMAAPPVQTPPSPVQQPVQQPVYQAPVQQQVIPPQVPVQTYTQPQMQQPMMDPMMYMSQQPMQQQYFEQPQQQAYARQPEHVHVNPVNVQPIQFQSLEDSHYTGYKENIGLIMDVPLQVTVELGRTAKLIREILEFGSGSIVELDKLAGEPVDILVNGKMIAKGEVVVIDESFGVRITDIVHPSKRL